MVRLTSYFNMARYFRRYIEREMYGVHRKRQWQPLVGWKSQEKKPHEWYYDEHRPWTSEFKNQNSAGQKHKKVLLEPIKEWKIFKGDLVEILVGKDKGKQGIINSIIKERNWCFVEGLNCEYIMNQANPDSAPMCQKKELPLLVTTQVKLVDPADNDAVDVEWRYTEDGKRVRVSTRTGRIVPIPAAAHELEDFVLPSTYIDVEHVEWMPYPSVTTCADGSHSKTNQYSTHTEQEKDTREKEVTAISFEPKLCTFDEDIMEAMGIKEDQKRAKTYWY